jgi:hypothetical protein
MKTQHKIAKLPYSDGHNGYNYRGYCVYGKSGGWYMMNEDGCKAWSFKTLKEFTAYIDKNYKRLE